MNITSNTVTITTLLNLLKIQTYISTAPVAASPPSALPPPTATPFSALFMRRVQPVLPAVGHRQGRLRGESGQRGERLSQQERKGTSRGGRR